MYGEIEVFNGGLDVLLITWNIRIRSYTRIGLLPGNLSNYPSLSPASRNPSIIFVTQLSLMIKELM